MLNFLNPNVFTTSKAFDEAFGKSNTVGGIHASRELMERCHRILRLTLLRRVKSEVEMTLPPKLETRIDCPLSEMQIFFSQRLLLRNSAIIKRLEACRATTGHVSGEDMKKLQMLVVQLRKAANHPYLFDGAEDHTLPYTSEEIVTSSGKMVRLDALLTQLLRRGHRVVIFSQFTRIMDIICDYLDMKNLGYSRLDGMTNRVIRQVIIDEFNRPGCSENIFVASTRAGGEGINLQTADTVILFDSDWSVNQRDSSSRYVFYLKC
jgi:SWI/SNF-related matrix-associated actin-dependent regulator of chromatin subfamily A member 5